MADEALAPRYYAEGDEVDPYDLEPDHRWEPYLEGRAGTLYAIEDFRDVNEGREFSASASEARWLEAMAAEGLDVEEVFRAAEARRAAAMERWWAAKRRRCAAHPGRLVVVGTHDRAAREQCDRGSHAQPLEPEGGGDPPPPARRRFARPPAQERPRSVAVPRDPRVRAFLDALAELVADSVLRELSQSRIGATPTLTEGTHKA